MGDVDDRGNPPLAGAATDQAQAAFAVALAAFGLGVPAGEVQAPTRGTHEAALARAVAMYLAHAAYAMSLARVGLAFKRDRSTVAHACHRIEDLRDDACFDAWIASLEAAIEAAPQARGSREMSTRARRLSGKAVATVSYP